jgi:hypothetical protein
MKTITQAAREYAGRREDGARSEFGAFIDGARFAQRWIPVEEELPEIGEYVFIKWRNGYIFRAKLIMVNAEDGAVLRWIDQHYRLIDIESPVTHWRHVELK